MSNVVVIAFGMIMLINVDDFYAGLFENVNKKSKNNSILVLLLLTTVLVLNCFYLKIPFLYGAL